MKKLILALMLLLNTNNAYSVDSKDLLKAEDDTEKFFQYCIQNIDNLSSEEQIYCSAFYRGVRQAWLFDFPKRSTKCGAPSFRDFSTKFNSLFYRNVLYTNMPTLINIYVTLNNWCENELENNNLENKEKQKWKKF